jgi:ParB-like chromosome segregation protein Spo0J
MTRPPLHPACAAYPDIPKPELEELAADIKAHGLRNPIAMLAGQIISGRCRWDACEIADIEPRTIEFTGDDPVAFVLSENRRRRHLPLGQKALIAAELVNLRNGSNQFQRGVGTREPLLSQEEIGKQLGISESTIENARVVKATAEPHIVEMVRSGEVAVRTAAEAVRRTDRAVQRKWTKDDVIHEGRKVVNAQCRPNTAKATSAVPRANIPYNPIKFPPPEETGLPINGTVNEQDDFREKYGRTPIHPKVVKDMLVNDGSVGTLTGMIRGLGGEVAGFTKHPDPDAFFTAIDEMLAWTPDPQRGKGYEIDFAAKARKHLRTLETCLDPAIHLLMDLQAAFRRRC